MTDQERITKLRDGTGDQTVVRGPNPTGFCNDETLFVQETADRIEELKLEADLAKIYDAEREFCRLRWGKAEAKLAKAVEVLRFYAPQTVGGITFVGGDDAGKRAAAMLAELEGK